MTCRHCGRATHVQVVLASMSSSGELVAAGVLCEACLDEIAAGAEINRQIFETLLAFGVPPARANALVIDRFEGRGGTA